MQIANYMEINTEKCEVLCLGPQRVMPSYNDLPLPNLKNKGFRCNSGRTANTYSTKPIIIIIIIIIINIKGFTSDTIKEKASFSTVRI